jgi:HK97 gp10 family phage protein
VAKGFYINFKVPELQESLKDMSKYDTKTAMKIEAAVSASTKAIGKGARQRVAVDSGDLRKSIRTSFNVQKVTGTISAKQYYAHFVEFGAKAVPSRNIPKRSERPYMRPAFEQERANLIKAITEAVKP